MKVYSKLFSQSLKMIGALIVFASFLYVFYVGVFIKSESVFFPINFVFTIPGFIAGIVLIAAGNTLFCSDYLVNAEKKVAKSRNSKGHLEKAVTVTLGSVGAPLIMIFLELQNHSYRFVELVQSKTVYIIFHVLFSLVFCVCLHEIFLVICGRYFMNREQGCRAKPMGNQ